MSVPTHARLAALRARSFLDAELSIDAASPRAAADVEVLCAQGTLEPSDAARMEGYRPVRSGWRWGPAHAVAWFRVRAVVPPAFEAQPLRLAFSSGTEALLWRRDGDRWRPWCGFSENHREAPLWMAGRAGEELELLVEAVCLRPLGATTFFFDEREMRARWSEPNPGRFEGAWLCVRDEVRWELREAIAFAADRLEDLGDDDVYAARLADGLERAYRAVDAGEPASALELVHDSLRTRADGTRSRMFPIGHAHLDTAWLWTTREARGKALRTFSRALRTLEVRPDFRFLATQPLQYAWVAEEAPDLFEEIRSAVYEGRWEPLGATWIEPDGNLPSGESWCRQLARGVRAMEGWFGERGAQRLLYLPDTFGFSPALPQLAHLAGLDTFVTNKLWWSETTTFPHVTFRWRGLDGTELLSHLTPGQDYNATVHPRELVRGARVLAESGSAEEAPWLFPYGFGDGGGGPTESQALRTELASLDGGLPQVDASGARAFCAALHAAADEASLPRHEGELYLELHRGTFTSQARLKQANHRLEQRLREVETLEALMEHDEHRRARIARATDRLLVNQFHDILPGSGTRAVVEEALEGYREAARELDEVERAWSDGEPAAFNPTSRARSGWFLVDAATGEGRWGEDVPPLGWVGVGACEPPIRPSCRPFEGGHELTNDRIVARFDSRATLRSLRARGGEETLAQESPGVHLRLHPDRPRRWEAWDVDEEDAGVWDVLDAEPLEIEPWHRGDLAGLRVRRALPSGGWVELSFELEPGGTRLDVALRCAWREERRWLRLAVPTEVTGGTWTTGCAFGHLVRSTARDTPADRARFEVPVQGWTDLSGASRGLAVLTGPKYGASCADGTLGLSLLRGPRFPDPEADLFTENDPHAFRIGLQPHGGDWRAAGVLGAAEEVANRPRVLRRVPSAACLVRDLACTGGADVLLASIARAADPEHVSVRLHEAHGTTGTVRITWDRTPRAVRAVDLLERPDPRAEPRTSGATTDLELLPFQVVTLLVEP